MLPLATLLASTTIPTFEDTETVVITRPVQTGLNLTQTTIYSGPGDFQAGSSSDFFDPAGVVQTVEATLVIDASLFPGGVMPTLKADVDIVTVNGDAYSVVDSKPWTYGGLPHLEIALKKGPQEYQGPK